MPSFDVRMPLPLTRLQPWYPGQFGIPGAGTDRGLRLDTMGKVIYVDPNFPGATASPDGTEPDCPVSTVAAALAQCRDWANDVILVMHNDNWTYGPAITIGATDRALCINESVDVTVHGVRIIGVAPSGALGPVWRPATAGGTCITVSAMDVLIEGFCFDEFLTGAGGGDAIYAEWNGTTLFGENLTVRHCFFADGIDTAIQLEYSWNCYVEDNVFQENQVAAIYVDPGGSGTAYNRIARNWFQDCVLAMSLQGCDDSVIQDNHVFNGNAQGAGVATDEGIDTTGGASNLVTGNWFSCLLPVPANGDWNDLNTSAATDAWPGNWCMDGMAVARPT